MQARERVTANDLDAAITCVAAALQPGVDRDWLVPAGRLEWTCRLTAEHIGNCLLSYSAQLAVQPQTQYVPFVARAEQDASPADVVQFVEAAGRILAVAVRESPPHTRGYHPYGVSDPEGFAGMGCIEALVHCHDIATGLELSLDPPRDVCQHVLNRMFPTVLADANESQDPWITLQWATGRITLPGQPTFRNWSWRGAPLDD